MKNNYTRFKKCCLLLLVLISSFAFGQTNTWKGGDGFGTQKNDWNRGANWSSGSVPTSGTNVVIPNVAQLPIISTAAAVCKDLTINSGATLNVGGQNLTVSGTTSVSGTITFSSTTGAETFTGLVIINNGGIWNNTNEDINFRGGITNNGTFNAGTGVQSFTNNAQALSGDLTIPNVTVTGINLTNNDNLTVSAALTGSGTLTNAATALLKIGGTSTITTLTATAAGNTVNYNGTAQTVKATNYSNLILSNSGTKTFAATTAVTSNLSIESGVIANLTTGLTHTAATLTLDGDDTASGSWGSTSSTATYKNNTYFTVNTGKINVGSGTCTAGYWTGNTSNVWNLSTNWCGNSVPTATTDVVIPAGVANMPNIAAVTSAVANNLTINAGATLTTANSSNSLLNIKGNFTNNGTLNSGAASIVTFDGSTASSIGGSSKSSFGNLTLNKTAAATSVTSSAKAFAVNGNLTVTQGNLFLAATDADYTVGKNLTVAATGTLTHNVAWNAYSKLLLVSGNVDISGAYSYSGAYTGAEGPRAHLQMNGPGTTIKTGGTALSILTIANTSGTISANGAVTVNDNFWAPYNTAGTFATGNNTVTANGALLVAGGNLNVNGGILNVSGGLYLGYDTANGISTFSGGTINADFINVGVSGKPGTNTFTHSGGTANIGNLTIDGTGTNAYTCTGSPIINISGTWTNSKTFTAANSTVNFIGTAAQALNGTLSGTAGRFYNLTFDGAGAAASSPIEISNKLSMTNGILNTGTNVVSLTNTANTAANAGNVNSFVSGPVKWSMAGPANTVYAFPVGKGTAYLPFVLTNVSAPTGTPTAQAEAFDSNSGGTADLSTIGTLSTTEYWFLATTGTFANSSVSLSRPTSIAPFDIIGGSVTKAGTYTSLLGTAGPNGITNSSNIGANRFFVFGRKKQKIVTGTVVSPICAGSTVSVPFTIDGTFDSGNVFTAQLSNSAGSFASPTNIGSLTQTTAGTISATIPAGTPAGSGYRIRVVSSNPNVLGSDNGTNITISDKPTIAAITAPTALCVGGSLNPTTPSVTSNGSTVTAQGWQLETGVGSGSFTNLTVPYAVTFADNGKKLQYYATNGCGTTTSNQVTLTVTDKPTVAAIATPTALCAGGSLNPTTPSVTSNGSAVTAQGWQLETGVGSGSFANLTVPYTVTFADNGKKLQYYATNGCGTITSNQVTLTVTDKPTVAAIATPTALCAGGSLNPTTPIVTSNGSAVTAQGWQLETGVGSGSFANLTVPYTVTFADNGKRLQYYATNGCGTTISNSVTVTVNALPTAAVTGNNQICKNANAVFALTGTAGATVTYNINGINQTTVVLDGSGKATVTVSSAAADQTLNIVSVSNGTCSNSAASSETVKVGEDSVYTGTVPTGSWSKGRPDGNGLNAVIAGNYNTSDGNINACNCTVNGSLTVAKDTSIEIQNSFVNNGTVTVESDGNFKQVNDVPNPPNSGAIKVKRNIKFRNDSRQEYNYLISPVIGQSLKTIYPGVPTTATYPYVLYYNEANNYFYNSSGAYIAGRGLAVKEPTKADVPADNMDAVFNGVPGNGVISFPLAHTNNVQYGYNLVGNPYPSNIDLQKLYVLNGGATASPKISSTFQFWDNGANNIYTQQGSGYNGRAYAVYNAANNTGNAAGYLLSPSQILTAKVPNETAKVGQGFMVRATGGGNLVFNNTIRHGNNAGAGFFSKGTQSPADRYWLKLVTPVNAVNTIAVVYFDGGSNAFGMDDSGMNGDSSDMLYSLAEGNKLQIEGKPMFDVSDKIILGSRHFAAGNYTFALDKAEGVFAIGQHIYLKDKQTGIITNLSEGSYTFAANAGESTGRFEIIYQSETVLATDGTVKDDLLVYRNGDDFVIDSKGKKITQVEVYDSSGRLSLKTEPGSMKTVIPAVSLSNGVYILKINQAGKITNRKIIR